ncbi:hypothetical protein JYU34_010354 [Plutella xylostella]|uniref:Uncharacterized protein n=1 Tax=Plutella xylostella TaxID=51655 RepID=A0ABQ7QJF2_PLUXY|nr:hypothetical protein JYU34_010354 [Plutella xylostella]
MQWVRLDQSTGSGSARSNVLELLERNEAGRRHVAATFLPLGSNYFDENLNTEEHSTLVAFHEVQAAGQLFQPTCFKLMLESIISDDIWVDPGVEVQIVNVENSHSSKT